MIVYDLIIYKKYLVEMSEFWVKYALRVCHIGSILALSYKTFHDYEAQELSMKHAYFYMAMGIVAITSGTHFPKCRFHKYIYP